jgi:hypothetical protein
MKILLATALTFSFVVLFGTDSNINAQGNRGGAGGNRPSTAGPPAGVGRPDASPGVDRGLGTASQRSNGRSDAGLGTASERSGGRSDSGLDRARNARNRAENVSDTDLNRYRGISRKLDVTPEELRARYEAALLANPDLKYGQFVAAHVVADNLGERYPNVTADAILAGYIDGDSIGKTLRNLGMTKEEAKAAERRAEDRIREAKRNSKN